MYDPTEDDPPFNMVEAIHEPEDIQAYITMSASMPRIVRNLDICLAILDRNGIPIATDVPKDEAVRDGLAAMSGRIRALEQ